MTKIPLQSISLKRSSGAYYKPNKSGPKGYQPDADDATTKACNNKHNCTCGSYIYTQTWANKHGDSVEHHFQRSQLYPDNAHPFHPFQVIGGLTR